MLFRCRIPRPPLNTFIGSIWLCEEDTPRAHALERVLPTGCAQLIVNLKEDRVRRYEPEADYRCDTTSGAVLVGAQTRHSVIDTSEQEYVMGVAFKPGGARPFLRMPASEAADADVPLDEVWDRSVARTLRERLLDAPDIEAQFDIMEQSLLEMWTHTGLHRGDL